MTMEILGSNYVMRHFDRGENPIFFTQLTTKGHKRARALFIPGITRIVSSPFIRCIQSVEYFARENGIPVYISCALGEYIDCDDHGIPHETKESMRKRVLDFIKADASTQTLYVTHQSVAEVICGKSLETGGISVVPCGVGLLDPADYPPSPPK